MCNFWSIYSYHLYNHLQIQRLPPFESSMIAFDTLTGNDSCLPITDVLGGVLLTCTLPRRYQKKFSWVSCCYIFRWLWGSPECGHTCCYGEEIKAGQVLITDSESMYVYMLFTLCYFSSLPSNHNSTIYMYSILTRHIALCNNTQQQSTSCNTN